MQAYCPLNDAMFCFVNNIVCVDCRDSHGDIIDSYASSLLSAARAMNNDYS